MASEVEIVNNALLLLGDKTITSLSDDSNRARIANGLFATTRDEVLRAYPWNCALARQSLPALSSAPDFGWDYQFQLPADPYCLRALDINADPQSGDPGDEFKIEGRKLLTNSSTCDLRYIARLTDPEQFDAQLYKALSRKLAADMAYAITKSNTVAAGLVQLYELAIRDARTTDGQEGTPEHMDSSTLTDVR